MTNIIETKVLTTEVKVNNEVTNSAKAMKKELRQAKKQSSTSIPMKIQIMEKSETGYTIREEYKKFGLVKGNRPIKKNVVNSFIPIIQEDKYDEALPIIAMEATDAIKLLGIENVTDLEGNILKEEEVKHYLVVLDGQHRISAFSKLNSIREEDRKVTIPHVHIKKGLENIREYLADINIVGKAWSMADKVSVASVGTGSKILDGINKLVEEKGFSVSTATLIYLGRKFTPKELHDMMKEGYVCTLEDEDKAIEIADTFLEITMDIEGMNISILKKRFYINGFRNYAIVKGFDEAFDVLKKMTLLDFIDIREDSEFLQAMKDIFDKQAKESVA